MTVVLNSSSQGDRIGEVFTPSRWASWVINQFHVVEDWNLGATIADPTGGNGAFIIAICKEALEREYELNHQNLSRLFLVERNPLLIEEFKQNFCDRFGLDFPKQNIYLTDLILSTPSLKVDILVGNPPWVNFCELPTEYKELLKPHFILEGLVPDKRKVLLGSARIDLSALILKVALSKLLNQNGRGFFFIPSSLFFGDGAHQGFRSYLAGTRKFCVKEIWEFQKEKVFDAVSTSYCVASFFVDCKQGFPIEYFRHNGQMWQQYNASPLAQPNDPLRVTSLSRDLVASKSPLRIDVSKKQQPRQGVNTCGANDIFIFTSKPAFLPESFLYPLVTREVFSKSSTDAQKWILIPYNRQTGKPLSISEIEFHKDLWDYLRHNRIRLESRKGTLLSVHIKKGRWWALLGVGIYSFSPYKVIWEAYGSKNFNPTIVSSWQEQSWQGNQAMHAFIPCQNLTEAEYILESLSSPEFQTTLTELNGGGKCNWAQPGKIKKLLSIYSDRH